MAEASADIRNRLSALCEAGAAAFDPVAISHVQRLTARAEQLAGPGQDHLLARALVSLQTLQERYETSRRRALQDVERLDRLGHAASEPARAAFSKGDLSRVRRIARRHPETEPRLRDQLLKRWEQSLDDELEKRGLSSPGTIDAPDPNEPAAVNLALALYRDAAASTDAALTIARAVKTLPPEPGRYHAGTVATHVLLALRASPHYLHALLERLEVVASLERGEPETQTPANVRSGKRRKRSKVG